MKIKVIYIDDDPNMREIFELYAKKYDLDFVIYPKIIDEVVEDLLANDYQFVVVDRQMPGQQGDDFIAEFLGQNQYDAKFVLFSGWIEEYSYQKLKDFSVRFIHKEFGELFEFITGIDHDDYH